MKIISYASGSSGNLYRAYDDKTNILLDCGLSIGLIKKHLNYKITKLDGVLVSHNHQDHAKAVKDLARLGIDCYMSAGTADAIGAEGHRVHRITPLTQFRVGGWEILPFGVQHDAAEPLGFLLASGKEKLLYATDTYYLKYRFNGLTHIMVECNYAQDILDKNVESGAVPLALRDRIVQSHFSLDNVKEFLRVNDLSKVEEIWLIHLSDGNSDAERFKREIQELTGKMVFVA